MMDMEKAIDDKFNHCCFEFTKESRTLFIRTNIGTKLFNRFYGEENRHYHGKQHIVELLTWHNIFLSDTRIKMSKAEDTFVKALIWWHDIVYDPRRKDNELTSAELFYHCMNMDSNKVKEPILQDVHLGILATTHFYNIYDIHKDWKNPTLYMLDLDLMGLGGTWEDFSHNSINIRKEFSHVPEYDYCRARLEFFLKLIKRGYIYHNPYKHPLFDTLHKAALRNIKDEVQVICAKMRHIEAESKPAVQQLADYLNRN